MNKPWVTGVLFFVVVAFSLDQLGLAWYHALPLLAAVAVIIFVTVKDTEDLDEKVSNLRYEVGKSERTTSNIIDTIDKVKWRAGELEKKVTHILATASSATSVASMKSTMNDIHEDCLVRIKELKGDLNDTQAYVEEVEEMMGHADKTHREREDNISANLSVLQGLLIQHHNDDKSHVGKGRVHIKKVQ